MSEHAVYAPSSAERWEVCTASAEGIANSGLELDLADGADKSGTSAHDEIERLLGHMNGLEKPERFGMPAQNPNHAAAYGIALFMDYVRQLPVGRIFVEQRVYVTDKIWGRCDFAHYEQSTGILTVVDYKNGYVDVDAVKNPQTRIYAKGTILTHKLQGVKFVRHVIVQPNSFMPVPRVKQWPEPVEDLDAYIAGIVGIPDGPKQFVAGEQCTYCPLFGLCPASKDVLAQLTAMLANPPDSVPSGQVAIIAAMEKPISDWFKQFGKATTAKALAGAVPPGMKVVTGNKHRDWKDRNEARQFIYSAKGIEGLEPPTPAQAEKLGLDIDALAYKPEGGPVLAFASDRRPEFKRKSVEEMFAGVVGK